MSNKFRVSSCPRRHDGYADCHRFKKLVRKSFISRVEHKNIRRFKITHKYLVEHASREDNAFFKVKPRNTTKKFLFLWSLTDDKKFCARIGAKYERHRFNKRAESFPRHETPDTHDKFPFEFQDTAKHRPVAGKVGRLEYAVNGNNSLRRHTPMRDDGLEVTARHNNPLSARSGE